jgi:hypothetical protein
MLSSLDWFLRPGVIGLRTYRMCAKTCRLSIGMRMRLRRRNPFPDARYFGFLLKRRVDGKSFSWKVRERGFMLSNISKA